MSRKEAFRCDHCGATTTDWGELGLVWFELSMRPPGGERIDWHACSAKCAAKLTGKLRKAIATHVPLMSGVLAASDEEACEQCGAKSGEPCSSDCSERLKSEQAHEECGEPCPFGPDSCRLPSGHEGAHSTELLGVQNDASAEDSGKRPPTDEEYDRR